jgi:hypothetical protein
VSSRYRRHFQRGKQHTAFGVSTTPPTLKTYMLQLQNTTHRKRYQKQQKYIKERQVFNKH